MILGGGAAGLMAAVFAKQTAPRARVTVLEAGERVGKKLLSTGNGRCNLTNLRAEPADYAPAEPEELQRFPPERVLEAFAAMGLRFRTEADGRVYPASDMASSVLGGLCAGDGGRRARGRGAPAVDGGRTRGQPLYRL